LTLPIESPEPLVAVGPHLKNTFTLVAGNRAFVSQHVGDLENLETLEHFQATLAAYQRLFGLEPTIAVHDLHPGYLSTRVARELNLTRTIAVQHHHAHIAAVLAEHGETGPVIGVAYDGTGYGDDGLTWGGELLAADLVGYRRLAHLAYIALPGGDLAARAPWRSALGYAARAGLIDAWRSVFAPIDREELTIAERQVARGLNAPLASSMGRLFDAAAAIIGVRLVSAYEGQAAMELEALAGRRPGGEIGSRLVEENGTWVIDPTPMLDALANRRDRGADPADLAADFHASVAWITERAVRQAAEATGFDTVVLGGGVFQNGRLLSSVRSRLRAAKLRVLTPVALSPNDGGLSYGQAAIAAAQLAATVVPSKEGPCASAFPVEF
jgi:hydrogenase maturation protein HypF